MCDCANNCSCDNITIPTGSDGADGSDGSNGSYGGNSSKWSFSTSTATGPSSGELRFDNTTLSSVTGIYIHDTNDDSTNLGAWLNSFDNSGDFGSIRIFKEFDSDTFWQGRVTAVTDNGTDVDLTVTHIASNGTFSASDDVVVSFADGGADGAAGSNGSDGTTVLHNDVSDNSSTSASYTVVKTFVLAGGTLSTAGSKLQCTAVFEKDDTDAIGEARITFVNSGGTHFTTNITGAFFGKGKDELLVEYTVTRLTATTIAVHMKAVAVDALSYTTAGQFTFEKSVTITTLASDLDINAEVLSDGSTTVTCTQLTVDHLIK